MKQCYRELDYNKGNKIKLNMECFICHKYSHTCLHLSRSTLSNRNLLADENVLYLYNMVASGPMWLCMEYMNCGWCDQVDFKCSLTLNLNSYM